MSELDFERWDNEVELPSARSNRPVKFAHRVEKLVMSTVLGALKRQKPERAARRLGTLLRTVGPWLWWIEQRGHKNLSFIYPDMTRAERSAILREVWYNLGATTAEFVHLSALMPRVEVQGAEQLQSLINGDGRAILFSAHMANWEALHTKLSALGLRCAIVYRAANNPLIDADIIRLRGDHSTRRQIPKSRRSARELLRALQDGQTLCLLTDQKLNDGVEAKLLGFSAMTTAAPARLALRENVPLIPARMVRRADSRFVLTIEPPIAITPSGDNEQDILNIVQAMNDVLGRWILEEPGQWLWFHRRWPRELSG